jgi:hypothetical protein
MKTIALAIPTLAHEDRARETSLRRTLSDLRFNEPSIAALLDRQGQHLTVGANTPAVRARLFTDRLENWSLGQTIFRWLADQDAEYVGVVQDDVRFHRDGWKMIDAMLDARPTEIIGLHAAHPALRQLFVEGGISWATTRDGLVGTMWLMPIEAMRAAVRFGIEDIARGQIERLHEDDFLGVFAMATGRKIYHPVVSPMDHDVSVASAYGNDNHLYRRPAVTAWEAAERDPFKRDWTNPETWRSEVAHLGRFYSNLSNHLPVVLRDVDAGARLAAAAARDACPQRYARFFRAM